MNHSFSLRLEATGLALRRGEKRLFEALSFVAQPGDFVELTGPNGAGKTSLLRALAGLLAPEAGTLRMAGPAGPLDEDGRAASIHLLGHRDGLKGGLDARAHLAFWAGLLGGGGDLDAALDRVGLSPIADLPARALSAGQGRRLALARLIAVPRPIWLMDEPAAALDKAGKALLSGLVQAHRADGGVVVAAVHEPLGPEPSVRVVLGAGP